MFFANVYKIGACVWDSMRALASLRQIPPFTLPHGLGNVYPLPLKILLNVWTVAKEYEKEAVYIHIVMEAIEAEFELIFFVSFYVHLSLCISFEQELNGKFVLVISLEKIVAGLRVNKK